MEKILKARSFDLILILAIAFLPSIIHAFYLLLSGAVNYSPADQKITYFIGSIEHGLSIVLLLYVLNLRGKTFRDLGIGLSWKEILAGIGLFFLSNLVMYLTVNLLHGISPALYNQAIHPNNVASLHGSVTLPLLLYVLINPFFEEMIVRGFAMTEVSSLYGNKTLAIIVSTAVQTSYHFYQGVVPALLLATVFLTFSIFYSRTGKLTPIIVAHLLQDLFFLLR